MSSYIYKECEDNVDLVNNCIVSIIVINNWKGRGIRVDVVLLVSVIGFVGHVLRYVGFGLAGVLLGLVLVLFLVLLPSILLFIKYFTINSIDKILIKILLIINMLIIIDLLILMLAIAKVIA